MIMFMPDFVDQLIFCLIMAWNCKHTLLLDVTEQPEVEYKIYTLPIICSEMAGWKVCNISWKLVYLYMYLDHWNGIEWYL